MIIPGSGPGRIGMRLTVRARRGPFWGLGPFAGLVWWVVGYLFWLLDGLRPTPVGPRMALPLSGSMFGFLVLGALVGGVAGGLLCLAAPGRRHGVFATLAGVAAALVVVLAEAG